MLPKMTFRTTTGGVVTTHGFGNCDAGSYMPGSSGWEVRIYNDYAGDGSEEATSVNINARGSTGGTDAIWCEQHWIEVKSNGYSTGSTGMTDDAMTVFQPVGTDSPLGIGDITSTGYRTLFVRVNAPTDAQEQNVSMQLVCTYQNPQSAITKWITGLRGDGVVATTGDPFAMSTGSTGSEIDYKGGYALIDNNEIYYGSSGTYDVATTGSGNYIIYLTESGTFGETTGTPASNQLALYDATISSGTCTALSDRRVYISGLQAGSTDSRPSTPDKGDLFFDIINGNLYGAKTSTGWTQINSTGGGGATTFLGLTDTPANYSGDANKLLNVNASSGAVEFTSSTGFKLDDFGTPDDNTDLNASTGYHGLLTKLTGSTSNYLTANGVWAAPPGSTGGEANTASNSNTTGVGVYYQKTGIDLEFKGIRAGSSKMTATNTTGTHTISVDVNSTGIKLDDLGTPDDNTDLNSSTSYHGLLPKRDSNNAHWLDGSGAWTAPTAGEVGAATTGVKLDDWATPDDNTDLNATTGRHGLLIKLTGSTSNYLTANGSWATPAGGGGSTSFTALTDTPANYTSAASKLLAVTTGADAVEFSSVLNTDLIKCKNNATTAPTANEDSGDGYAVNSVWGDVTNDKSYICIDATTGAAVWKEISPPKLDDCLTPDDNTDLNSSTGKHGLLLKLTGSASTYLNANGVWATPPNSTGTGTFVGLTDTPANFSGDASKILRVNSSSDSVEFVSSTGIATDTFGALTDITTNNATTGKHGFLKKLNNNDATWMDGKGNYTAPTAAEVGAATTGVKLDDWATPDDNTDLNSSTSYHGLLLKRDGNAAHWLDGSGAWTAPTASEVGALYSSGAFTAGAIPEISTTGGVIKASPFVVTTGDVLNFGAHSAGFTEQAIATTTGTAAINWNNGIKALYIRSTGANGAVTFTFIAPVKSVNLQLTIRGSTAGSTGTVTLPTANWAGGTLPSFSTGASAIDVVSFSYSTGLTKYLGLDSVNFSTV